MTLLPLKKAEGLTQVIFSNKTIIRHCIIWLLIIIYLSHENYVEGPKQAVVIYVTLMVLNFSVFYYLLTLWLLPKFYAKVVYLVIMVMLANALFVGFDALNLKIVLPYFNGSTARAEFPFFTFVRRSTIFYFFICICALGSYNNLNANIWYREAMEKEKSATLRELNFLKNQFHSHFTLNFFNVCYSRILSKSAVAAQSVENYCEILHYTLKTNPNGYVALTDEIAYLENFIAVQKCIGANTNYKIQVQGEIHWYKIVPMILPIMVENAAKHGAAERAENPIEIELVVEENIFSFRVTNSRKQYSLEQSSGIGLENLKRTLNIYYPGRYSFSNTETEHKFTTQLTIQLNAHDLLA